MELSCQGKASYDMSHTLRIPFSVSGSVSLLILFYMPRLIFCCIGCTVRANQQLGTTGGAVLENPRVLPDHFDASSHVDNK